MDERIELHEILSIAKSVADRLADSANCSLNVRGYAYWSVSLEKLTNVASEPPPLGIGLVSEDLENLKRMLEDPNDISIQSLSWLASLLSVLAHQLLYEGEII